MTQTIDQPNFATWERDNLVRFCQDCYAALLAEQEANEQLRIDLKDAMKMARQQILKDNAA
jgi:hypothetical protein